MICWRYEMMSIDFFCAAYSPDIILRSILHITVKFTIVKLTVELTIIKFHNCYFSWLEMQSCFHVLIRHFFRDVLLMHNFCRSKYVPNEYTRESYYSYLVLNLNGWTLNSLVSIAKILHETFHWKLNLEEKHLSRNVLVIKILWLLRNKFSDLTLFAACGIILCAIFFSYSMDSFVDFSFVHKRKINLIWQSSVWKKLIKVLFFCFPIIADPLHNLLDFY